MLNRLFATQARRDSCGLASLSLLLRRHGILVSEGELIKRAGTRLTQDGVSLGVLRDLCQELGVTSSSLQYHSGNLSDLQVPCIAHFSRGHFVLLDKIYEDKVHIIDPAIGPLQLHVSEFLRAWSGSMLILTGRKLRRPADPLFNRMGQDSGRKMLSRLLQALIPYWPWVSGLSFLMILNAGISVSIPLALAYFIDRIVAQSEATSLALMVSILAGITITQAVLRLGIGLTQNLVSNGLLYDLRASLMEKILKYEFKDISNANTGDIFSRLTNDVSAIQGFISNFVFSLLLNGLSIVVLFGVALSMSPTLALLGIAPLPIFVAAAWWLFRLLVKRSQEYHRHNAMAVGQAQRIFQGLESVKAYGRDDLELSLFSTRLIQVWRASFSLDVIYQIAEALVIVLGSLGPTLIIWLGGSQVLTGTLSLGVLVGLNVLMSRLFEPILQLTRQASNWQLAKAAADRYFEVLDHVPAVLEENTPVSVPMVFGAVEIERVSVDYGRGPVLKNVTLSIEPGETVALVGPNGGGKSTLVQLIMRFVDPTEGRVLVDGVDVTKISLKSLRSQTALVNPQALIFDGTILENIAYGRLHASVEEIIHAAQVSGFHAVVEDLPDGYDSVVSRNGLVLSTGQRQKLALARALLRQPSLLIMDEATSSLDVQAEDRMYKNIRDFLPNTTLLIVAHRPWVTARADKLVYVEGGQIAGQGTHKELIKHCAQYRKLCEVAGLVHPTGEPKKGSPFHLAGGRSK